MTVFCDDLTFGDGFGGRHDESLCYLGIYLKYVHQNQLKRVVCFYFSYYHDFYDGDLVIDSQQANLLGCYSFHLLHQLGHPINLWNFYELTFSTKVFSVLFQLISKTVISKKYLLIFSHLFAFEGCYQIQKPRYKHQFSL